MVQLLYAYKDSSLQIKLQCPAFIHRNKNVTAVKKHIVSQSQANNMKMGSKNRIQKREDQRIRKFQLLSSPAWGKVHWLEVSILNLQREMLWGKEELIHHNAYNCSQDQAVSFIIIWWPPANLFTCNCFWKKLPSVCKFPVRFFRVSPNLPSLTSLLWNTQIQKPPHVYSTPCPRWVCCSQHQKPKRTLIHETIFLTVFYVLGIVLPTLNTGYIRD